MSKALKNIKPQKLIKMNPEDLVYSLGISKSKANLIMEAVQLTKDAYFKEQNGITVRSPMDAFSYCRGIIADKDREHLIVLILDNRNRIIDHKIISIGTINSTTAHPREIFKYAITNSARSFILAHNHPSGDTTASSADIEFTKRIYEASKILDIPIMDHIIITPTSYNSLKDAGIF